MKTYDMAGKVAGAGEHILGFDATGSHACYLIYGVLRPGEAGRELRPGAGHEEMVLVVQGALTLQGAREGILRQGHAVHLVGDERCLAANAGAGDAVYVVAGGHSGGGHH